MSKKKKLEGFEVQINEFGEIISSLDIDQVNDFLDENLHDKKLEKHKKNETKEQKDEDE